MLKTLKTKVIALAKNKKGQISGLAGSTVRSFVGLVVFLALVVALTPVALESIGNLSSLNIVLVTAIVAILPILIGVFILVRGMDFFKMGR